MARLPTSSSWVTLTWVARMAGEPVEWSRCAARLGTSPVVVSRAALASDDLENSVEPGAWIRVCVASYVLTVACVRGCEGVVTTPANAPNNMAATMIFHRRGTILRYSRVSMTGPPYAPRGRGRGRPTRTHGSRPGRRAVGRGDARDVRAGGPRCRRLRAPHTPRGRRSRG